MKMTRDEQRAYRDYMVSVRATKDAFETAISDGFDEGIREGIKEGRKEGRKEGIKEGRKEGIKEGRKEREKEIARSLKGKVPVDIIISSTGLTAEEIAAL
jgi:predicted transposase YdaD